MNVGILTLDLALFDAQTLKDKRRVIEGLRKRIRNRFNVSVAEIEYLNTPKRCRLCIAMVSRESRPLHSQLDLIVDFTRKVSGASLIDYQRELY